MIDSFRWGVRLRRLGNKTSQVYGRVGRTCKITLFKVQCCPHCDSAVMSMSSCRNKRTSHAVPNSASSNYATGRPAVSGLGNSQSGSPLSALAHGRNPLSGKTPGTLVCADAEFPPGGTLESRASVT
jgi:hypothetical protein